MSLEHCCINIVRNSVLFYHYLNTHKANARVRCTCAIIYCYFKNCKIQINWTHNISGVQLCSECKQFYKDTYEHAQYLYFTESYRYKNKVFFVFQVVWEARDI